MLTLSTKGRYATRIMVCLARRQQGVPVRKEDIARAEDLSSDYTEQLLIRLKAAGLVRSRRGRRGGFTLGRAPETITVADVVGATEGPVALVPCLDEVCRRQATCPTRPVWKRATEAIREVLAATTIAQIAQEPLEEGMPVVPCFDI